MSQIDEASRRLEAALARLDRVIAQRAAGAGAPAGQDTGSDPETAAALAEARAESANLQKLAGDVSRRLDDAIARLDRMLEG
jgi:hypothetical protein